MMNAAQISVYAESKFEHKDYTSFEVWMTSSDIDTGTSISGLFEIAKTISPSLSAAYENHISCIQKIGEGDIKTYEKISASMEARFLLTTCTLSSECDIVIDWGDGSSPDHINQNEGIVSISTKSTIPERLKITVGHTYEKEGRYIVKVYGKDYFGINNNEPGNKYNCVSRCFEEDLQIADHVTSIASFANGSPKLLGVVRYSSYKAPFGKNVINMPSLFTNAKNLSYLI